MSIAQNIQPHEGAVGVSARDALDEATDALAGAEQAGEAVQRDLRAALADCEQAVQRLLRTRFKVLDALESMTDESPLVKGAVSGALDRVAGIEEASE